jgi:hypothetical protein
MLSVTHIIGKNIMKKVFVYWNLHKKCWSVKDMKTGLVIKHTSEMVLVDCKFKVSEAGRQRVIREKRKNVHAGVVGFLTDLLPVRIGLPVYYNPYKQSTFTINNAPIHDCDIVRFFADRSVMA